MYHQDSLYAVSTTGMFDLPKDVFGIFYFRGYSNVGPCPIAARSSNLVISTVHPTLLDSPWFYPNPASNTLTTAQTDLEKVIICDLLGRALISWEKPEQVLSISSLTNGSYILLMQKNGQIFRQNIIVQKM
mgnify:FL=1